MTIGDQPGTTRSKRHIDASPDRVYRLLIDREAVAEWKVPEGMTSVVHAFDPRAGGEFRISLSYDASRSVGKSSPHTDTYHGRFLALVPNEQVVETMAFETDDPLMRGQMTVTYALIPASGGTDLVAVHDGLPPGISADDNQTGWRMALDKLAALAEGGSRR